VQATLVSNCDPELRLWVANHSVFFASARMFVSEIAYFFKAQWKSGSCNLEQGRHVTTHFDYHQSPACVADWGNTYSSPTGLANYGHAFGPPSTGRLKQMGERILTMKANCYSFLLWDSKAQMHHVTPCTTLLSKAKGCIKFT